MLASNRRIALCGVIVKCDSIMVDGSTSSRHGCRCPDGFGGDHCELNASSSMASSNKCHEDDMDSKGTKTVLVVAVLVRAAAIVSLITFFKIFI